MAGATRLIPLLRGMPSLVEFWGRELEAMANRRFLPGRRKVDIGALWEARAGASLVDVVTTGVHATQFSDATVPGWLIAVTTYRRPEACAEVLRRLHGALEEAAVSATILVLNDASDFDYEPTAALAQEAFGDQLVWLDARQRIGKRGFWKTHQTILQLMAGLHAEHLLALQDDLVFEPSLVATLQRWHQELDHGGAPALIHLFSAGDEEPGGRWVNFQRRRHPTLPLYQTQWFDLQAFFLSRPVAELLEHQVFPVGEGRWLFNPSLSSGVGRQLTWRLASRARIYQAHPTLVGHGAEASEMNPEARAVRPLTAG